jgi:hypothetical protein
LASNAFGKFKKTTKRCETLVGSYSSLHALAKDDDTVPPASKDIIRGAVVLAVAALDAYVTDVFSEKLTAYLRRYAPDESLVELLQDAGLDTREALRLVTMERPFRRIGNLLRDHHGTYTTQRFVVIDELFLNYRLKDLTDRAQERAGRKTLKRSVELLIERRHKIAHGGDYDKYGRIRDIEPARIKKRIQDLELLVENMDAIICSRV